MWKQVEKMETDQQTEYFKFFSENRKRSKNMWKQIEK